MFCFCLRLTQMIHHDLINIIRDTYATYVPLHSRAINVRCRQHGHVLHEIATRGKVMHRSVTKLDTGKFTWASITDYSPVKVSKTSGECDDAYWRRDDENYQQRQTFKITDTTRWVFTSFLLTFQPYRHVHPQASQFCKDYLTLHINFQSVKMQLTFCSFSFSFFATYGE